MPLQRQTAIKETIKKCLRAKFRYYKPETDKMPFHYRLLGKERTLLEWGAAELARDPSVVVNTMIGIPYNLYAPKEYKRWTMKGMLDLNHEVLIAENLWDFLGGEGSYTDLLDAFEKAGLELRDEIDTYFEKFR